MPPADLRAAALSAHEGTIAQTEPTSAVAALKDGGGVRGGKVAEDLPRSRAQTLRVGVYFLLW